jgi:hypothetical protein
MPLQHRRVFDRRSLLVNFQGEIRIESQHFRHFGLGFRFFAQRTLSCGQIEMGPQIIGVAGESLFQGANRLLIASNQNIGVTNAK